MPSVGLVEWIGDTVRSERVPRVKSIAVCIYACSFGSSNMVAKRVYAREADKRLWLGPDLSLYISHKLGVTSKISSHG